jgi:hypothetical protein
VVAEVEGHASGGTRQPPRLRIGLGFVGGGGDDPIEYRSFRGRRGGGMAMAPSEPRASGGWNQRVERDRKLGGGQRAVAGRRWTDERRTAPRLKR